jgi:hypothetical protein
MNPGKALKQGLIPLDLHAKFGIEAALGTLEAAVGDQDVQARVLYEKAQAGRSVGNNMARQDQNLAAGQGTRFCGRFGLAREVCGHVCLGQV